MFDFISDLKELRQSVALLLKKVTDIETILRYAVEEEPEPRPVTLGALNKLPPWVEDKAAKDAVNRLPHQVDEASALEIPEWPLKVRSSNVGGK